ncbi:MAG: hypothetical protein ACLFV7_10580 [Phycisphaerae bacterium]
MVACVLLGAVGRAHSADGTKFQVKKVEDHKAPASGEHPRLILRTNDIEDLRKTAATEKGKAVVYRIRQATKLMNAIRVTGGNRDVLKEAGFKAAGFASIHILTGEKKDAAESARIVLNEIASYPMPSRLAPMERISRLHGAAIAYDLASPAWNAADRKAVRGFLSKEARYMLENLGNPSKIELDRYEQILAATAAGIVHLTLLDGADDTAANKALDQIEKAVIRYLDEAIGEKGIGKFGGAQKYAALASGILPFAHANRLVRGRDIGHHPALQQALPSMVYQTVPKAGIAQYGRPASAWDRSGIFAEAISLTPQDQRPAVDWLFRSVGGDKYQGVVRPHQGLYMLMYYPLDITPAAPDWKPFLRDDQANVFLFRNRFKDEGDFVVTLLDGNLRMTGKGGRFASRQGAHVRMYAPHQGRIENFFGFHPDLYRASMSRKVSHFESADDGSTAVVTLAISGQADRKKEFIEPKRKKRKKDKGKEEEPKKIPVPEVGKFSGSRSLAVDYTGKSGADVLIVLADRIEGADDAVKPWIMHVGAECRIEAEGNTFTVIRNDVKLRGTVIASDPDKTSVSAPFCTPNPQLWNFISATGTANEYLVVMTVDSGKAPQVKVSGKGLDAKVTIGGRKVSVKDGNIVLG